MTTDEPNYTEDGALVFATPSQFATCAAGEPFSYIKSVQPTPDYGEGPQFSPPRALPLNLADPAHRERRMATKAVIPAGYTYFAQLIAHDLGNSVDIDAVPHRGGAKELSFTQKMLPPVRYNLIENPLTLETVYGPGPTLLTHVFDHRTFLFRVIPKRTVSVQLGNPVDATDHSIRALYDGRNRDTTFLHRLAVIWMKYHNYVARDYQEILRLGDWREKAKIYSGARSHVISVWHEVIRKDFLRAFVDPARLPANVKNVPDLDETTLLHGVFRTFHALPRSSYFMSGVHQRLTDLLLTSLNDRPAADRWSLSWEDFFTGTQRGTKTGLSASVSPSLTVRGGLQLSSLDLRTADAVNPQRLGDEKIKDVISHLGDSDASHLDPGALAQATNDLFGVVSGSEQLSAEDIEWMPLFATLMIEADLHGKDGRFGPLGGLILTKMIEDILENVVVPPSPSDKLPRFKSMLEIIDYVQNRERKEDA